MEASMPKTLMSLAAATVVFAAALVGSANAATVNDTLKACKNSPGCGYSKLKRSGDYVGCSVKSQGGSGTCFYCNTSTNNCFQVRRVEENKWKRVWGNPVRALNRVDR
jgi:hypothetical protein